MKQAKDSTVKQRIGGFFVPSDSGKSFLFIPLPTGKIDMPATLFNDSATDTPV